MCKKGGPRCPQTPGKKARVKLNKQVNKIISQSGMDTGDWKIANLALYDQMVKEAFGAVSAPVEEDTSWVNYRDTGTRVTSGYDEDEELEDAGFLAGRGIVDRFEDDEDDDDELTSENHEDVNAFILSEQGAGIEEALAQDAAENSGDGDEEPEDDYEALVAYYSQVGERQRQESINNGVPAWTPRNDNRDLLPPDAVLKSPNPNPVFVYGTLRKGMGNYRNILEGYTQREKDGATLPGATMYSNGGFPYVLEEDAGGGVKGDIIYLDYDNFAETLQNLDYLEGTGDNPQDDMNHYNRALRYVQTGPNEYTQAWVYMPPDVDRPHLTRLERVESGDWFDRY